jgi:EAL domain-containing protein (putative c-di-GMP-specific phosphodiesterase class I)
VCEDAHRHWQSTGRWLDLHVNVSSRQLLQFNYQELLMAEIQRVGMPARALTVELTESIFIGHDDDRVSSIFAGLKAVGVLIAVDDFGTGYSSLSYLERLPLDCLKIDRSFVLKLADPGDRGFAVAAAVIDVGNRLGLKLVAEGVETPVQARQLQALGCKLAQGYLFAKPTPWDEMALDLEHTQ